MSDYDYTKEDFDADYDKERQEEYENQVSEMQRREQIRIQKEAQKHQNKVIQDAQQEALNDLGLTPAEFQQLLNEDPEYVWGSVKESVKDHVKRVASRKGKAPKRPVHRGAAPSAPAAAPKSESDDSTWTASTRPVTGTTAKWNPGEKQRQAVKERGLDQDIFDELIDSFITGIKE